MWYAVYTRSRFEKKIEEKLLEKRIEVFLPVIKKLRQWKDRKKWISVPLFNNYLFVNIDYRERYSVLETNGVVRFITFQGKPVPISDSQIDSLKIAISVPEKVKVEDGITIGKPVIVTSGPLKGVKGVISEKRGQNYVHIVIESINKSVSIDVHSGMIELLETNEKKK
ncbi:MAG: UpxY family transcription antiterminator [Calditrichia bacterium]|nr:UpxY family transcription antiterminator [Calditrichia bacterium]